MEDKNTDKNLALTRFFLAILILINLRVDNTIFLLIPGKLQMILYAYAEDVLASIILLKIVTIR